MCGKGQVKPMQCSYCGRDIPDDAVWCPYCGAEQTPPDETAPPDGWQDENIPVGDWDDEADPPPDLSIYKFNVILFGERSCP